MDHQKDTQSNLENVKNEQLEQFRADHKNTKLTTNQGVTVSDTENSLKAGERGPTIMEDFHFREKMMHFDHERIPERVVHARGFGVHGHFQVYESMKKYTKAKFLQDPSVKTPVFVRFSTVVGSRGSADTVRDVRGFATKFFTEDGNYDLVGNNMPVFFIQDGIKFPDLVHAIKPEPDNEIPQASAAHDTFWDFVVNNTETAHMIMWLLSDRGIPRSFRMMEGFGVHTFRFVNEQGKGTFVKFHWKPKLGVHSLTWDEAQKIAGKDPDFHRRDLWDAVNQTMFPEFELGVQLLAEEDEFKFNFDILDATKIWPEELIPVKIIGKMTLDRNQDNFFAETEQVAFHTGNVVPGIDFTNDPLLQGRLFSYQDTQLLRLGGPNFHEIPINRPIAPIHNNQRDGFHRMTIDKGKVSYHRNSLQQNSPTPDPVNGYTHYTEKVEGYKIRNRSDSFNDHYTQATLFWNSMSETEKKHIIKAFHFEVGNVKNKTIKQKVVEMFNNVDGELATQIAQGIGVQPPATPKQPTVKASSPALSQMQTIKSAQSRKVAILANDGFNLNELIQLQSALKSAGVQSDIISKYLGTIKSTDGQEVEVNKNYATAHSVMYDAVCVVGGQQSVNELMNLFEAKSFINDAFVHLKPIAAINEGVDLLSNTEIKNIHLATGQEGQEGQDQSIEDKGIVTARNTTDLTTFNEKFIQAIASHRHWIREEQDGKISG
ncbi:catalase [Lysinibacillus sp. BW-2-10]|uniref:catalase n=1 Tax=Lysinibacillus sp. BW-2-10 TaxID=2590030 RepID=UPI00118120DB|nr:catalase [Lysinibacillus sp. BW-2-10]TSI03703.1 catalase [Lysinibacillus sp. BW-2-10]